MEFEWDENKNVENIKIHDGISFEEAVSAFFDEWALDVSMILIRTRTSKDLRLLV